MSSPDKNRRWGRKSDGSRRRSRSRGRGSYIPPVAMSESSLSGNPSLDDTVTNSEAFSYVTSPPKRSIGNISSLFRRSHSKEPSQRKASSSARRKTAGRPPEPDNEGKSNEDSSVATPSQGSSSRLFYSSHGDDNDSEDSYESRTRSISGHRSHQSKNQTPTSQPRYAGDLLDSTDDDTYNGYYSNESSTLRSGSGATGDRSNGIATILRYRGFSTSIQSLFLDEALVCASMGCFGLVLSNRTEYLLQLRNDRRGVRWGRSSSRRTLPSRIVAYALWLTLILIALTFVIWGFGSNKGNSYFAEGFYGGYDNESSSGGYEGDDQSNANGDYDDGMNDDNGQQQQGDDGNYNGNDDGQQQQGDDGNNWNQGDDGNYNQNNDDAGNDDGNNNQNNDDGANGDDANGDDGAAGDDYYAGDDDNNGRKLSASRHDHCVHKANGIFKLRDMNEGLWEPAIDFIQDEWNRPDPSLRFLQNDDASDSESSSVSTRDLASDVRSSLILAFLVVLGILGRRRRMRSRYYLVRARAQEDHLFYASSAAGVKRVAFQDSREDQYEGACSHTLCGCYPVDPPKDGDEIDDEVKVDDDGVVQGKRKHHHDDCVSRGFRCLTSVCCGFLCKCWFQCLSICALAQEAREIRLLVPTRFQRVDYFTHQPFHEYQKDVNDLRRGWLGKTRKKSGMMPHFNALSRLSRYILGLFVVSFVVIVATLLFNPRASFSWPDAVILMATFIQSFFVIYFAYWIFHKSDLSLDAVIKFFAAGFLIAVPSAFFFESLLVNLTLTVAYLNYVIGEMIKGEAFVQWVVEHYRWLWIIGELFNAYVVAAVTEELCKYYTFRCVEHPDLVFLTGLARASQDARAVVGGMVKYPFGSHQVQKTNKQGDYDDDDCSVYSSSSRSSHRSSGSRKRGTEAEDPMVSEEEFYEDEHDVRTHRQKAAAVTTGMISVAVGLTCAENLLYVFLLGGSSTTAGGSQSDGGIIEEWIVLLFRSLFPVHALAAAMQSVNMIRKFVECEDDNNHRVGVGRIILPAVIMHGSFDAVLLFINVYIETAWEDYLEDNNGNYDPENPPYNAVLVNCIAWLSIIFVMVCGILWYYRENRNQRSRLIMMEEKQKAETDSQVPYSSPSTATSGHLTSEVELV